MRSKIIDTAILLINAGRLWVELHLVTQGATQRYVVSVVEYGAARVAWSGMAGVGPGCYSEAAAMHEMERITDIYQARLRLHPAYHPAEVSHATAP